MNHSVDAHLKASDTDSPPAASRYASWPVLIAILVYPLVTAMVGSSFVLLTILGSVLVYLVTIYLYQGIAAMVALSRWKLTLPALTIAIILGLALTEGPLQWQFAVNMVTLAGCGVAVGLISRRSCSQLRVFISGLVVVVIGAALLYAPNLAMIEDGLASAIEDATEMIDSIVQRSELSEVEQEEGAAIARKVFAIFLHLVPSGLLLASIMQYSIGFLWFMFLSVPTGAQSGRLKPFTAWKMPFALMPVVFVVGLLRLVGDDTLTRVVDNTLVVAAVFYCVTGLAFIESRFQKVGLPVWLRAVFYVSMTVMSIYVIAGLILFMGIVLLGFLDSYFDWRKPREGDVQST